MLLLLLLTDVLRQLQGKPAAAKRLYQDIFINPRPPQTPASTAATATAAGNSSTCSVATAAQRNRPPFRSAGVKHPQQRPAAGVGGNEGPKPPAAAAANTFHIRPGHKRLVALLQTMIGGCTAAALHCWPALHNARQQFEHSSGLVDQ